MINTRQPSTLRDYLQIGRRRLWIILTVTVLTVVSAAFFSARQEKLYQASAKVLVSGIDSSQTPDRFLQTQADVATASPEVARRVRKALGLRTTPPISVTPNIDSDILVFSSTAATPQFAAQVATGYAQAFSKFQRELATKDVKQALRGVEAQIKALGSAGAIQKPTIYSSLVEKRSELLTLEVLQTTKAFLVQPAAPGVQVQPKLARNIVFGLLLGLVAGIGLALLREALDTRVRSTDEISERLGIPLLARLPRPRRELRLHERLVMVNDPEGPDADAFRILRASVDFARMATHAKALMVTSAAEGEGKSTTAANLAVAMARGGQHVILVDLDLRRPFVHKFFNLDGPGVAHVATGRATLEDALAPIPLLWSSGTSWNGDGGEGQAAGGMLEVMPAGPMLANVDDVLANQIGAGILEGLRQRADVVLVDSTPLFAGDAMALSAAVDGVLIVVGMNLVRRPMLRELRRVLDAIPTPKLGFIAASDSDPGYSGYGMQHRPAPSRSHETVA